MTAWVDEIEKRLNAATPGPWNHELERYSAKNVIGIKPIDDRWIASCQPEFNGYSNAELIAHAPVDIAKLIKAHKIMVEALQSIADINEPDSAKTSYWKTEHDCFLADVIVNDVHDAREALKQIEDLE